MTKQITSLTEVTTTEDGDLLLIRDATDGVDKKMQAQNLRAKATTKDDVGLGSVPNLDTTDAVNKAHDQNTDTALDQGGANEVTAADARAHIDSTANPHGVTKTQVGLGNVDNVSAADLRDRSTHTGTQPLSTISDAGTIASQDANSVNIDGGTIDGTSVNATTLTASGDVNFDSGTLFVDESTNRVGIGTTSPSLDCRLEISSNDNNGLLVNTQSGQINILDNQTSGPLKCLIGTSSNQNLYLGADQDNNTPDTNIICATDATERMRIDSSGNVGIGTTSPSAKLHLGNFGSSSALTMGGQQIYSVSNSSGARDLQIVFNNTALGRFSALIEVSYAGANRTSLGRSAGRCAYALQWTGASSIANVVELEDVGLEISFAASFSGNTLTITPTTTNGISQINAIVKVTCNPSLSVNTVSLV